MRLGKSYRALVMGVLLIALLGPLAAQLAAQTAEIPRRTEAVTWNSGNHNGQGHPRGEQPPRMVRNDVISVPGVPWMQLQFNQGRLGKYSYIEITSLADGATQRLDAEELARWKNRSAYFNGDAVRVRLFVGPQGRSVSINVPEVIVGEWGPPAGKSICGVDDRIASTEPRTGRIDPIGCTGWTIDSGQLLSAGHCLAGGSSNQTLSFNPPASLPDGTVQFPGPDDQYTIDQSSFNFTNGGVGNDWGVFAVFDNGQTGLQPIQAQGSFTVRQDFSPSTIRITGYGVDSGTTNQTNQTHAGPNTGSSGTTMRYATDTTGGNSGSPVIDEATGEAVGIHTHGGCASGNNNGTSFFNTALWNSIDTTPPPPPPPPPPPCSNALHTADFESGGADGWVQGADTCTTGGFVVGNPDGVTDSGVTTQVAGSAAGTGSFFTQPNGGGAGSDDVDGGTCEALSPSVSASGSVTVSLDYFHGQRDAGDDAGDGFSIEVLRNGVVAATLASFGDVTNNAAWTGASATVDAGAGSTIQLRVRATDAAAGGDLVEAGVDNVQICGSAGGPPPPPPPCSPITNDFEGSAAGWVNDAASTCTTGDYVLGTPSVQTNGGVTTQVGGANSGVNALFTATNTGAGTDDVDGGNCILSSPTFAVSCASTLSVAYFHGQRDAGDDASGDFFSLEVSTDGGSTFQTIESVGDATSNASWSTATTSIPAGSDVVLRVQCSDGAGPGDLVECGIDDFAINPN